MNPWLETENLQGEPRTYYDRLYEHLLARRNPTFIETGTLVGNGIQQALRAGFSRCISIEIHKWCYDLACARFAQEISEGRVEIHLGNSEHLFPRILDLLNTRATFWLDAHISSQYGEKLAKNCPVLEELDAIQHHWIRDHDILIDDCNCFDDAAHDWISLQTVQKKILAINPRYQFTRLDAILPENILAAHVDRSVP